MVIRQRRNGKAALTMPKLGVNIDHVATLRQAREGLDPEPGYAALICEDAGANSIVAHLREDRRHINDADLNLLRKIINTRLNLEMSCAAEIVGIACKVRPDQATLVPEKRRELTTEGGLDIIANFKKIKNTIAKLQDHGIEVSLFIDPNKRQIDASKKSGARIIELHTGRYADALGREQENRYFKELEDACIYAKSSELVVNAGHGLDYFNTPKIAAIKEIEELNIGYSIICRAVIVGLKLAVMEMKRLCV
jgi:pyridoxine 5-phosphate synthase